MEMVKYFYTAVGRFVFFFKKRKMSTCADYYLDVQQNFGDITFVKYRPLLQVKECVVYKPGDSFGTPCHKASRADIIRVSGHKAADVGKYMVFRIAVIPPSTVLGFEHEGPVEHVVGKAFNELRKDVCYYSAHCSIFKSEYTSEILLRTNVIEADSPSLRLSVRFSALPDACRDLCVRSLVDSLQACQQGRMRVVTNGGAEVLVHHVVLLSRSGFFRSKFDFEGGAALCEYKVSDALGDAVWRQGVDFMYSSTLGGGVLGISELLVLFEFGKFYDVDDLLVSVASELADHVADGYEEQLLQHFIDILCLLRDNVHVGSDLLREGLLALNASCKKVLRGHSAAFFRHATFAIEYGRFCKTLVDSADQLALRRTFDYLMGDGTLRLTSGKRPR